MSIVDITYEKLNNTIGISKYEYSEDWLKKSKSYYAYLNSTGAEASYDVLLGIWGEALGRIFVTVFDYFEHENFGENSEHFLFFS